MRESEIEKSVCSYARQLGWLEYKWSSPGNNGVPDRMFFRNGFIFFIEFKATGKDARKLQKAIHRLIRKAGFQVYVINDIEKGEKLFDSFENF